MSAPAPARGGARSLLVPSLFTLVVFILLIQFGNWQMRRLAWKEALIEQVETRTKQPPAALPPAAAWSGLEAESYDYSPVRLRGRFLHDRERYVYTHLGQPRGRYGGAGYWVMTPLVLADGGAVLVNRGFVPLERKDPATRPEGRVEDVVMVEGLMRRPEARGLFTPDGDPAGRLWFVRDPESMKPTLGLPVLAPFTVDAFAGAPGALPQGGETRLSFPNRHREYALTWYGLAGGLVLVYAGLAWSRLRRGASA